MDDAISRSAAIEALNQHSYETSYDYDKTVELLNELPALDVAPKWISVEDRLPEEGQPTIIRIERWPEVVFYAVAYAGKRTEDSTVWETGDEDFNCNFGKPKVTHWMPFTTKEET